MEDYAPAELARGKVIGIWVYSVHYKMPMIGKI